MAHSPPEPRETDEPTVSDADTAPPSDAETPPAGSGHPRTDFFNADHLQTGLRARATRGGAITVVSQALRVVLRLAGLGVLARFVVPDEFGVFYAIMPVVGFITLFREAGLSTATVQRREITDAQISTLFWVNLALGALVAGIVAAIAPVLASFYDHPAVKPVTFALAGTAFLAALSVQHHALLRRQMRFGQTAMIDLGAIALGLGCAIIAAWQFDAGYWALVVEQYAATIGRVVLTFLCCPWRPGLPRRGTGVRPMLAFGGNLTGSTVLNYIARNADKILIAKFVGTGALGLYGNAYRLLTAPLQNLNFPISSVAVPTLSRLQDQPERFARYYHRAIALLVFVSMPLVGFAFAEAPRLVTVVLGERWIEAATIFRALGPAALVGTFNIATGWVYVAMGRTDRQLRWNLLSTALTLIAFVVGLRWEAIGVAAAFSAVQVLERGPAIAYCYRGTFLRLRDLAVTLARPAAASIGAAALLMGAQQFVQPAWPSALTLILAGAAYVLMYGGLWCLMPGGIAELAANVRLAREWRDSRHHPQTGRGA